MCNFYDDSMRVLFFMFQNKTRNDFNKLILDYYNFVGDHFHDKFKYINMNRVNLFVFVIKKGKPRKMLLSMI